MSVGTTLVHAPDLAQKTVAQLEAYSEEFEFDFPTLELNFMLALDFDTMLADSPHGWSEGEPLLLQEEVGLVVYKVNPAAVNWILTQTEIEDEAHREDLKLLRAFIERYGTAAIYEWATF